MYGGGPAATLSLQLHASATISAQPVAYPQAPSGRFSGRRLLRKMSCVQHVKVDSSTHSGEGGQFLEAWP